MIAAGQMYREGVEAGPPAVSSGTPQTGGVWNGSVPMHTQIGTWVKIDASGLFLAGGGTIANNANNGGASVPLKLTNLTTGAAQVNAATMFAGAYPGEPIQGASPMYLPLPVAMWRLDFGAFYWQLPVFWRGWPWKWPGEVYGSPTWSNATVTSGSRTVTGSGFPGSLGTLAAPLTAGTSYASLSIIATSTIGAGSVIQVINSSGQTEQFTVGPSTYNASGSAQSVVLKAARTATYSHASGDPVNVTSALSAVGVQVVFRGTGAPSGIFTIQSVTSPTSLTLTSAPTVAGGSGVFTMNGSLNAVYFGGNWPLSSAVPNAANGGADGAPYTNLSALNTGYSFVPDTGSGVTSAVFCVAPGDQGYLPTIGNTKDTRVEPNQTDNFSATGLPPAPTGVYPVTSLDVFGNASLSTRYWRHDFEIPASWTAPVPVGNTQFAVNGWPPAYSGITQKWPPSGSWAVTGNGTPTVTFAVTLSSTLANQLQGQFVTIGGSTYQVQSVTPTAGTTPGRIVVNANVPAGSATLAFVATNVVTNTKQSIAAASNMLETQGPSVFVWAAGTNTGTQGGIRYAYTPTTGGMGGKVYLNSSGQPIFPGSIPACFVDALTGVTSDGKLYDPGDHSHRINTIVEYSPGYCATLGGVPWIVPPGTKTYPVTSVWSSKVPVAPYGPPFAAGAVFTAASAVVQAATGQKFSQALSGQTVTAAGVTDSATGAQGLTVASVAAGGGSLTLNGPVALISGSTLTSTLIPITGLGGGWFRIWRCIGMQAGQSAPGWTCVSPSTLVGNTSQPVAIPGTATIAADGTVAGDPVYGQHAGKVFGATLKTNGAALAPTTVGSTTVPTTIATGTAASSLTALPVNQIVALTNFASNGGQALIFNFGADGFVSDYWPVTFQSYANGTASSTTGGAGSLKIVGGGTSPATFTSGSAYVFGLIIGNDASPGINQGASLPTPCAVREWPLTIGPTFASVNFLPPT